MNTFFRFVLKRTVIANAVMMVFVVGGIISAVSIRQELLPRREEGKVEVTVELPGASPDEIDTSVLAVVENALQGQNGVKRVDAGAREGTGVVTLSLLKNADPRQVLGEVKKAVDRITTFPKDAEAPVVTIPSETEKALSIIVYGDQPMMWLRKAAQLVRDDLRTRSRLTKVELAFPPDPEISVEISEKTLRQYGWTLEQVVEKIRESAINLPGGTLYTPRADMAVRTSQRPEYAKAFLDLAVARSQTGVPLRLGDVAVVKEGFGESPIAMRFNGHPAIQIDVWAVGHETPVFVETTVRQYLENHARNRYKGVEMVIFENQAAAYGSRRALLLENAGAGLVLVLAALGLFLSPNPAFWVMAGIPVSLLGGLLLLPLFNASINMISLFAFIVTIGVVVDDAIMMAEAIHTHRARGLDPLSAALAGAREMWGAILLAATTTIAAFSPMFFIPGELGEIFRQIPVVIIAVLLVSLIESMFILPAHLAKKHPGKSRPKWLMRPHALVNSWLEAFIWGRFRRFTEKSLLCPGILIASAFFLLLVTSGAVMGGLLDFSFMPTIESDTVIARAALPYGTPKQQSEAVERRLIRAAQKVLKDRGIRSPGILSLVGTRLEEGEVEVETLSGSHYISALTALLPDSERTVTGREFAREWQKAFGVENQLTALTFTGETKISGSEPIRLEVFHPDPSVARNAAVSLGKGLRSFAGFTSIDDGVQVGKPELTLTMKQEGAHLGLTALDVARQIRHRYHGAEALRFVRDGNEINVMVRLTEEERSQAAALDEVLLMNSSGSLVPLTQVADIAQTHSFTRLARRDGRRIYPVTADTEIGFDEDMLEDMLEKKILPALTSEFPGVSVKVGGEEEELDESLEALANAFWIALGVIYFLLTLYFNSFFQPLAVLSVIPFSFIGALWGHILLGCDISIVSVLGIIAVAGVVVNDSLVLVTAYNRLVARGADHGKAIADAACQRFRPILLTSLTTLLGLMPLLLETSEQAQFLIGAAISMSFGLGFGTIIVLVMMPGLLCLFPAGRKADPPGCLHPACCE